MPTMDDIYKLKYSRVFSKLDAAAGYHQIPLEKESAKLTTFITPMGRYYSQKTSFWDIFRTLSLPETDG